MTPLEETIQGCHSLENEVHTAGLAGAFIGGRTSLGRAPKGLLQPDDKLGEMRCGYVFEQQLVLVKKAVIPQEPRAIGLDRGGCASGRCLPVKEEFHFGNEVEIGIHQVPHASAIGSVSCYHVGKRHHAISKALSQKERTSLSFFHSRWLSKEL